MWNLLKRALFGSPKSGAGVLLRAGKPTKADAVFDAWTSGDLSKMLGVLDVPTNFIDRHCLLMSIVKATYKRRKEEARMRALCNEVADLHLQEFPVISPALAADNYGTLTRVSTFQHYATLLTEDKNYAAAIRVCESAISYGLHHGTKSGYAGRIVRICKKQKG